jgi:bifunctional oligoribonuclease and PAP phosphatase NrnA
VTDALDAAYAAAAAALVAAPRVVVASHTDPDGDALGSLVGAVRGLAAAGIDTVGVRAPGELVRELRWLDQGVLATTAPAGADWLLLAVDCGSEARLAVPADVRERAALVVSIDHHHDNTRFAAVNVVDPAAACTAMMVRELLARLGVALIPEIATPLYVGLVTDTGRFQYSNTDERAFAAAAEFVAAGARPQEIFQRLYESVPAAKLVLLGRALERIELRLGGRLAVTWLTLDDVAASGADASATDGVIEQLRAIEGVEVAAFVRETANGAGRHKVSLRSAGGLVDVSAIARAGGGGGHARAAGFSSDLGRDELFAFIEAEARTRDG